MNELQHIDPSLLDEADDNENVMSDETFHLLVEAIDKVGFLQPICVEASEHGRFKIVDGAHRTQAARLLGLTSIPCIVRDGSDGRESAIRISMNHLRGQLDLTAVAKTISSLEADGWSMGDLSLTGFSEDELEHLLASTRALDTEDLLTGAPEPPDKEPPLDDKPWVLELRFDNKKQLATAKRGLRKAAGKGGELGAGLLRLLDCDDTDESE